MKKHTGTVVPTTSTPVLRRSPLPPFLTARVLCILVAGAPTPAIATYFICYKSKKFQNQFSYVPVPTGTV